MPKENKEADVNEAMKEFLSKIPSELHAAVKAGVRESIQEVDEKRARARAEEEDDDDFEEDEDEPDYDEMNNRDLVNHMTKTVTKLFAKAVKPLSEQIESTRRESASDKMSREILEVRAENPDLPEWKAELQETLTKYPSMNIAQAYKFVKANNPEKANEIQSKMDTEKAEKNPVKRSAFGGLTPTSSLETLDDDTDLSPKEAADKAWDSVMGEIPTEFFSNT